MLLAFCYNFWTAEAVTMKLCDLKVGEGILNSGHCVMRKIASADAHYSFSLGQFALLI